MATIVDVIFELLVAALAASRAGLLTLAQVKEILDRYPEPTPENIAAARREILDAAGFGSAVDDARVRALLQELGVDPETLRITG